MSKTPGEVRSTVVKAIRSVAPETDFEALDPGAPLRDQVDIDSMDFLNIMVRIHDWLDVDILESDYSKLTTLDAFVTYLSGKLNS